MAWAPLRPGEQQPRARHGITGSPFSSQSGMHPPVLDGPCAFQNQASTRSSQLALFQWDGCSLHGPDALRSRTEHAQSVHARAPVLALPQVVLRFEQRDTISGPNSSLDHAGSGSGGTLPPAMSQLLAALPFPTVRLALTSGTWVRRAHARMHAAHRRRSAWAARM